jgi:hypothetical protein
MHINRGEPFYLTLQMVQKIHVLFVFYLFLFVVFFQLYATKALDIGTIATKVKKYSSGDHDIYFCLYCFIGVFLVMKI